MLGRDEIPFEEMVKLDYLYVTSWSMLNDVKLILRTIPGRLSLAYRLGGGASALTVAETIILGGNLAVRRLGLGTMELTGHGTWGEPRDPQSARALLQRARELEVDFFDTADSYGPEVSERLVAEALYPWKASSWRPRRPYTAWPEPLVA